MPATRSSSPSSRSQVGRAVGVARRPTACGRPGAGRSARRPARCEGRGRVDVVVVPVRADDRPRRAGRRRPSTIGSRVVRGVDDEHLVVVADEPDVVVDLEVLAVDREDARCACTTRRSVAVTGAGRLSSSMTTTERSTSPRSILWKASSTPSSAMVSDTKRSRSKRPCRYRSMSIGKSRDGQAVAVPRRLERPAPAEELDHRDVGHRHVGLGTPTCTTVPARSRAKNACSQHLRVARPPRCTRRRRCPR